jgi:Skp family chaperone for outer membrane proteins
LALCAAGALSIALLTDNATAQAPGQQPQSLAGQTVLLDVNAVFKAHVRFKAMMEDMQRDVEQAETDVKQEKEKIRQLGETLQQYHPGTQEYVQFDTELTKRQSDLAVKVQMRKKEFIQQEAKIYFSVYQEIMAAVEDFAGQTGIALVMRFNRDPASVEKPDDVLREINKAVVWSPRGRDITDYIVQKVNAGAPLNASRTDGRMGVPMPGNSQQPLR